MVKEKVFFPCFSWTFHFDAVFINTKKAEGWKLLCYSKFFSVGFFKLFFLFCFHWEKFSILSWELWTLIQTRKQKLLYNFANWVSGWISLLCTPQMESIDKLWIKQWNECMSKSVCSIMCSLCRTNAKKVCIWIYLFSVISVVVWMEIFPFCQCQRHWLGFHAICFPSLY